MEESKSDSWYVREVYGNIQSHSQQPPCPELSPLYPASSPEPPLAPDFPGPVMVNALYCVLRSRYRTILAFTLAKQTQNENDDVRKWIFFCGCVACIKEALYSPSSAFDWLTSRLRRAACVLNNRMYFRQTQVRIRWNSKEEMIASQNNTPYLNVCCG